MQWLRLSSEFFHCERCLNPTPGPCLSSLDRYQWATTSIYYIPVYNGAECESVPPAAGHVVYPDPRVALCHPPGPQLQRLRPLHSHPCNSNYGKWKEFYLWGKIYCQYRRHLRMRKTVENPGKPTQLQRLGPLHIHSNTVRRINDSQIHKMVIKNLFKRLNLFNGHLGTDLDGQGSNPAECRIESKHVCLGAPCSWQSLLRSIK